MPNDIIIEIFSLLKPDFKLFLINKRIYGLNDRFIIVHLLKVGIPVKITRTPVIDALLYYYGDTDRTKFRYYSKNGCYIAQSPSWSGYWDPLKKDLCIREKNYHILYIMSFISDKTRNETIYTCKNSYKRNIAHQFCEKMNLNHETIEKEYHFFDILGLKPVVDHRYRYIGEGPRRTKKVKVIKITKKKKT